MASGSLIALLSVAALGCSTTRAVELDSAQVPAVAPADGGQGQNEAEVIEAGAIELDATPHASTSTTVTSTVLTSTTPTSTTPTSTTVLTGQAPTTTATPELPSAQGAAMIDELCDNDRRELRQAIDEYRADYGMPPTSEADLLATAYIRHRSDLYDVWVDGTIVAQDATCA